MKYYKILVNAKSCHGGSSDWSLPSKGKPGKWMPPVEGELKLCERGYHILKAGDIIDWLKADCEIYEVSPKGKVIYRGNKGICRSARLARKLKFDDKIARSFACDCAERVLPIFEKIFPDDKRPRVCIETARKFIFGLATQKELDAARDAARAAAWDAARDAAWDAAWDAARAAARDAARAAARAAAGDAAWDAEKKWQTKRLQDYLYGRINVCKPKDVETAKK